MNYEENYFESDQENIGNLALNVVKSEQNEKLIKCEIEEENDDKVREVIDNMNEDALTHDELQFLIEEMNAKITKQNSVIRSYKTINNILQKEIDDVVKNSGGGKHECLHRTTSEGCLSDSLQWVYCSMCSRWAHLQCEYLTRVWVGTYCCRICEPTIDNPYLRQTVMERRMNIPSLSYAWLTEQFQNIQKDCGNLKQYITNFVNSQKTEEYLEKGLQSIKELKKTLRTGNEESCSEEEEETNELLEDIITDVKGYLSQLCGRNKRNFEQMVSNGVNLESSFRFSSKDAEDSMCRLKDMYDRFGKTYSTFRRWEFAEVIHQVRRGASILDIQRVLGIKKQSVLNLLQNYDRKFLKVSANVPKSEKLYTLKEQDELLCKLSSQRVPYYHIAQIFNMSSSNVAYRILDAEDRMKKRNKGAVLSEDEDIGNNARLVDPTRKMSEKSMVKRAEDNDSGVETFLNLAPCPHCRFRVAESTLNMHIKCMHKQLQPITCDLCDLGFRADRSLEIHMKECHDVTNVPEGKRIPCEHCHRFFATPYVLQLHMNRVKGEAPFKCRLCPKRFQTFVEMKKHRKNVHLPKRKRAMYTILA